MKLDFYYFAPAGVRSIAMSVYVCLSVCLSVCPLTCLKNHTSELHELCSVTRAVARSSSDDSVKRNVLPVMWMTSCFHKMGPVACSVGIIYVSSVLEQAVINFQGASSCLSMFCFIYYISRESWTTRNLHWSRASLCLCVCPRPHAHTTARTRI